MGPTGTESEPLPSTGSNRSFFFPLFGDLECEAMTVFCVGERGGMSIVSSLPLPLSDPEPVQAVVEASAEVLGPDAACESLQPHALSQSGFLDGSVSAFESLLGLASFSCASISALQKSNELSSAHRRDGLNRFAF